MENVVVLAHDEVVRVDETAISALRAQMGEAGAEGVMNRALEEIANRLTLIERCHFEGEREALWKAAKGLIGISEQIGLISVAGASRGVADCALGRDRVALNATMGRLIRLGDRALTAVWSASESTTY
ncbi:MAG: hypothetical protein AAGA47_11220 [Pseudomonadota bacterium]